jgi:glycerol-3-phosphate acyltransferase PlsY
MSDGQLLVAVAVVLGAYLSGSIPFGKLVARRRGVDIERVGSGNIGATNVARTLGKRLGALVLLLDAAKGAIPVAVVRLLQAGSGQPAGPARYFSCAAALGAVLGHCFSPWLRLRGGKGVATALGVMLVASPIVAAASVVVFGLSLGLWRRVSVASLAAVSVAVPVAATIPARCLPGDRPALVILTVALALVIWVSHRGNLRRLRLGEEPRLW